jgi:hypothetical protein
MKHTLIKILLVIIALQFAASLSAEPDAAFKPTIKHRRGSVGVGYGLCYGGLGFNGDFNFTDDIAVSGSLGTFGYVGGYELGLKYFFLDFDKTFRPKVSAWYGVNSMIVVRPDITTGLSKVTEAHKGFCAGVGGQWMFGSQKKHGFDADVLYIITTTQTKRIEELESQGYGTFTKGSRFLFSFGYRFAF